MSGCIAGTLHRSLTTFTQIWFQNRRQSSRRKSRPLLPHEIAQYHLSRFGPPDTEAPESGLSLSSHLEDGNHSDPRLTGETSYFERESEVSLTEPDVKTTTVSIGLSQDESLGTNTTQSCSLTYSADAQSVLYTDDANDSEAAPKPHFYKEHLDGPVPVTTHGSISGSRRETEAVDQGLSCQSQVANMPEPRLKKSSSFVRLSMTSEGKATIITKDTSSPSPPRLQQSSQTSSLSTHEPKPLVCTSASANSALLERRVQRTSTGRSRDSRAWEFWCDKDARGDLEDKAEKDASGSAADAIGLLRSTSGRSILGPIPSVRNSTTLRRQPGLRHSKGDAAKPTLRKPSTSFGRLQQHENQSANSIRKAMSLTKHPESSATSIHIPGNDSDKENWSPETGLYSADRAEFGADAAGHSLSTTRPLTGPIGVPRHNMASTKGIVEPTSGKPVSSSENDPEADPELVAFMRHGRKSNSVSEEEDLDCVHGLLSLSQGNWR